MSCDVQKLRSDLIAARIFEDAAKRVLDAAKEKRVSRPLLAAAERVVEDAAAKREKLEAELKKVEESLCE